MFKFSPYISPEEARKALLGTKDVPNRDALLAALQEQGDLLAAALSTQGVGLYFAPWAMDDQLRMWVDGETAERVVEEAPLWPNGQWALGEPGQGLARVDSIPMAFLLAAMDEGDTPPWIEIVAGPISPVIQGEPEPLPRAHDEAPQAFACQAIEWPGFGPVPWALVREEPASGRENLALGVRLYFAVGGQPTGPVDILRHWLTQFTEERLLQAWLALLAARLEHPDVLPGFDADISSHRPRATFFTLARAAMWLSRGLEGHTREEIPLHFVASAVHWLDEAIGLLGEEVQGFENIAENLAQQRAAIVRRLLRGLE